MTVLDWTLVGFAALLFGLVLVRGFLWTRKR